VEFKRMIEKANFKLAMQNANSILGLELIELLTDMGMQ
jgi:hypothetical protein